MTKIIIICVATDVVALLRCSRYSLGIMASSRGVVAGRLLLQVLDSIFCGADRYLFSWAYSCLLHIQVYFFCFVTTKCINLLILLVIGTKSRGCGLFCMWVFWVCYFWWLEFVGQDNYEDGCTIYHCGGEGIYFIVAILQTLDNCYYVSKQ